MNTNITIGKSFFDISLHQNAKNNYVYPLLLLHTTGLYVFLEEGEITQEIIDKAIYPLQQKLSISRIKMQVYSTDKKIDEEDGNWWYLNPFSDCVNTVDNIDLHLEELLNSGTYYFDETWISYLTDKMLFEGGKRGEIKQNSEGQSFIRKNGAWLPMSSESTEEVFYNTIKFDWFGWFQFHRGKKFVGVFYLLTLGLFGVGYFFDVLSFFTGSARDVDGFYYEPLKDKKRGLIFLGIALVVAIVLCIVYMTLFSLLNTGLGSILAASAG